MMVYVLCAFVGGLIARPVLGALLVWYDASRVLRIDMHSVSRRQQDAAGKL